MKKSLLLLATTALLLVCRADAEVTPEKRAAIEEMFRLTGMEKLVNQMMSQMVAGMRAGGGKIPDAFWGNLTKRLDTKELIELIIPVYDKHYTLEDIRAVNAFHATPAGQKILATTPQVMQETMAIGQEWGAKHGKAAQEETQAALKSAGKPAPK